MITNLEEFYKKIQNPILNDDNFDRLLETYSRHNFLENNYTGYMNTVYADRPGVFNFKKMEDFYTKRFNYWKKRLVNAELTNSDSLYSLQQYFKGVSDAKNKEEAIASFPNKKKAKYLNLLFPILKDSYRVSSNDIYEDDHNIPFPIEHHLYVNVDLEYLYILAGEFLEQCEAKNLPYLFNIESSFSSDKSFVVQSDTQHLLEYYKILSDIITKYPNLKEHIKHPPALSGVLDNSIGYQSAEVEKGQLTNEYSHLILAKGFKKILSVQPNLTISDDDGEKISVVDVACERILEEQIEGLANLDKKVLKDYYNLKPRDLNNKKFLNSLFENIKKEMLRGIQAKDFKFNDVVVNTKKRHLFRRNSVNQEQLVISHEKLSQALANTYKKIVDESPNAKSLLQQGILQMAKEKGLDTTTFSMTSKEKKLFKKELAKKEKKKSQAKKQKQKNETKDILKLIGANDVKLIGTNNVKLIENKEKKPIPDTTYHLQKEQIIQDLPIYSKQESRFQGRMSEEQIKSSKIKLGFIRSDTTYRLKRDQIIQDLPIHSKQESRFQGRMSEEEIIKSQEKIKTYCKK